MEAIDNIPDPFYFILLFSSLTLIPFIAVMATSFVKISVVLSLLRNALGVQQAPPNIALHGIAIVMTIFIMAPVGLETYDLFKNDNFDNLAGKAIIEKFEKGATPFKNFLRKHSEPQQQDFFIEQAKEQWPKEHKNSIGLDSLLILMPAFVLAELTEAFKMGFLLYLPFLTIDLVVSNVLLAMGMMMVSPMTISLPFKLLLFVLVDGWAKIVQGLVLSY